MDAWIIQRIWASVGSMRSPKGMEWKKFQKGMPAAIECLRIDSRFLRYSLRESSPGRMSG